ncbi:Oxidoreductase family, NAD-binding rossmann fold protein [Arachis hypogaea]|nr:Oxidoreductase family, NAD-binding rossmann fold protein [Arachis hypogaea]
MTSFLPKLGHSCSLSSAGTRSLSSFSTSHSSSSFISGLVIKVVALNVQFSLGKIGVKDLKIALQNYKSVFADALGQAIWSVAKNYRFEPALVEGKKLVAEIGAMMSVQVIIEGSMNSSNPYFASSWRSLKLYL